MEAKEEQIYNISYDKVHSSPKGDRGIAMA
jgi:hypothetical protein